MSLRLHSDMTASVAVPWALRYFVLLASGYLTSRSTSGVAITVGLNGVGVDHRAQLTRATRPFGSRLHYELSQTLELRSHVLEVHATRSFNYICATVPIHDLSYWWKSTLSYLTAVR